MRSACSGKTSLLFNYCYKAAARGVRVALLCRRSKLEQTPPLLPGGVQRKDAAFKHIGLKYIEDIQDLKRYGACLHLLPDPPGVIVIDGLSDIADASRIEDRRSRDTEITKAVAYIVDALEAIKTRSGVDCQLIVSDLSTEDGPKSLYLLQRWIPLVITITGRFRPACISCKRKGKPVHTS
eukprot:jgi/Chrzof1/488/Cz01g17180.t1